MRLRALLFVVLAAACGSPEPIAPPIPAAPVPAPIPAVPIPAVPIPAPIPVPIPAPIPIPAPTTVLAARAAVPPTIDALLDDPCWSTAERIPLDTNWRGEPSAPEPTTVRLAWAPDALFVAFEGGFEGELDVPAEPPEIEAEHLYAHDALEIFLDPDPSTPETYLEIELGPGGHVLDVSVDRSRRPRGDVAWSSGLSSRAVVDAAAARFVIEARIPATALGGTLAPRDLRVGLFRIGTAAGERYFLARFPTMTERASFHVPERFGTLRLDDSR